MNKSSKTNFILHASLALFAGSLLTAVSAFSAVGEPVSESRATYERRETPDISSRGHRVGKVGFLTAQPVGFSVFPFPSMGINGGYFIDPDKLVQVELGRGRLGMNSFDIGTEAVGVNLKFFTGNSFYLKFGGAYRSVALTNVSCVNCGVNGRINIGAVSSVGAEFAIGNQWQWENFTLGCDWVGVMVPLATAGIDGVPTGINVSARDRIELDKSWTTLARATSTSLLKFYLGASF